MTTQPAINLSDTTGTCCSPAATASDKHSERELAALCKALGHPTRVRILQILSARSSCVCGELVEMLPVAQSTVSEHLRLLKQAGLVQGEVDGPRMCYCINPDKLVLLKGLVAAL